MRPPPALPHSMRMWSQSAHPPVGWTRWSGFFGALPMDSGAAYVVMQHLSPDHKSMMDNLLGRYTAMPVRVAKHGVALRPTACS
ncbi:MAG: chemotaxis protein CheB [Burkholderiaceae bacterium]|nr:chemotaxis protein CheB [Burkholderiaceae bacterium]